MKPETEKGNAGHNQDRAAQEHEIGPPTPEQVREQLMDGFHERFDILDAALTENREGLPIDIRPRGVVVMVLWEEGEDMLTTAMAEHSLSNLREQAELAGIDLDIILVANNGGGSTAKLGDEMSARLEDVSKDLAEEVYYAETVAPEGIPTYSQNWPLKVPLGGQTRQELEGKNRLVLVKQPIDPRNKGKLRGIRDVTHAVMAEIVENGYAPDFVMEMDAESTLRYASPRLQGMQKVVTPLKVLWNQFYRNDRIGVGTKDRFAVMDPDTGAPDLSVPVRAAQKGYELTNTPDKFITLPGGAMMVKPEYYLAGMSTIAEVTPGMGVHDYLFTKLLRAEMELTGRIFEEVARSLGIVTHINRTPDDLDAATKQMQNWRTHARAADSIFPGDPYHSVPFETYVKLVIAQRIKDAYAEGPAHLLQLIEDIRDIPATRALVTSVDVADITSHQAVEWTPSTPQKTQNSTVTQRT